MKKKILIILLIIIISFALGIAIRSLNTYLEKIEYEKNHTTFVGVIEYIENNNVFLITENENLNNTYTELYFKSDENPYKEWQVGDKLEIKFHNDNISENGLIKNPIFKYFGKTRLFNNKADIPVSNSGFLGGNLVFKSFYDYNSPIKVDQFYQTDEYFIKKIINYNEYMDYQEMIPEIRTLTEDDFVNYYALIILTPDTKNVYTLESYEEAEESLTLNLLKRKSISKPSADTEPTFSGISIVVPNSCDLDVEKINLVTK